MKVFCGACGCFMGEMEGRLRKGWVIICADCHIPKDPGIHAVGDDDLMETLMGMFGMKGGKK